MNKFSTKVVKDMLSEGLIHAANPEGGAEVSLATALYAELSRQETGGLNRLAVGGTPSGKWVVVALGAVDLIALARCMRLWAETAIPGVVKADAEERVRAQEGERLSERFVVPQPSRH